eukprot:2581129-Pyramimonas_sp.AAC.1
MPNTYIRILVHRRTRGRLHRSPRNHIGAVGSVRPARSKGPRPLLLGLYQSDSRPADLVLTPSGIALPQINKSLLNK